MRTCLISLESNPQSIPCCSVLYVQLPVLSLSLTHTHTMSAPLDVFRKRASFDWKQMRLCFDEEESIKFKQNLWKVIQNDPLFKRNQLTPTLDEFRRQTVLKLSRILSLNILDFDSPDFCKKSQLLNEVLYSYEPSICVSNVVNTLFCFRTIQKLGTEKHNKFLELLKRNKIFGAYALTEVAHGSNAKDMQTTATYDASTKEFVLNTKNFESAKCWIANLGQKCTHAVVYAQLIMPDGTNHGLHAFIVPVRHPKTHLPLKGIKVYDLCEKLGLQGVDNGAMMMSRVRIPQDYLLDRNGTIDENGQYVSPFENTNMRFASALGVLLLARLEVFYGSILNLSYALVIAIRYSVVRLQFGPPSSNEWSVIEYQLQQMRLFPWLAMVYVLKGTCSFYKEYTNRLATGEEIEYDEVVEIHGILSVYKAYGSWIAQEGIQSCREACGGHGYLKIAGIGALRDQSDLNITYEGENNVLIQQTSNWLLNVWRKYQASKIATPSPFGSIDFMFRPPISTFPKVDFCSESGIPALLEIYEWLLHFLLNETTKKFSSYVDSGVDRFTAKSKVQQFRAKDLALAFGQYEALRITWKKISSGDFDKASARRVMCDLSCLFALHCLYKWIPHLLQGGLIKDGQAVNIFTDGILQLCENLKNECVALVDAISPPDFILNSVLGTSDGKVYENLQNYLETTPYATARPSWFKEIFKNNRSKL